MPLLILCVAVILLLPSQEQFLSWSRQYLPNTQQQESTAPARNGPRQERHQNYPSKPEQQQRLSHNAGLAA
jgi:hypothetical protein